MRFVSRRETVLSDDSGNVLILVALFMTAFMGFTALAVDVGLLFRAKRNLQTIADAAATAGALNYYHTGSSSYAVAAATTVASNAGLTKDDANGDNVVVNNPPKSGPFAGSSYPGFVEVIITQPNPTFFMRASAFGENTMSVAARAVAGNPGANAPNWANNLSLTGNGTIEGRDANGNIVPAPPIYVNSNVNIHDGGTTLNVSYVADHGTFSFKGNLKNNAVIQNAPAEDPPQALMINPPVPSSFSSCGLPPGTTQNGNTYTASITSMNPGTCYGIDGLSGGNNILNLTISNTTLASGLYTFDLGSGGTLTLGSNVSGGNSSPACQTPPGCAGITLDIYTGNFSVTSQTNDSLYAPSDGPSDPYNGILLYMPPSNTGTMNIQWGSASGTFAGIIDAMGATVTMQDQGGADLITGFAVGNLGPMNGTLDIRSYQSVYPNGPLASIALVE